MKLIYTAPIHGRHETVRKAHALNKQAGINDFVYCATAKTGDRDVVESLHAEYCQSLQNNINLKAQQAITKSRSMNPDAVILMGSDNYIDHAAYIRIEKLLIEHDYIAFEDCIFDDNGDLLLWPGYPKFHRREGEPAGAGKVVRLDLLGRLGWKVWSYGSEGSTDKVAHDRIMQHAENPVTISCVRDGVKLVDIKDQYSKTPISKFHYLKRYE